MYLSIFNLVSSSKLHATNKKPPDLVLTDFANMLGKQRKHQTLLWKVNITRSFVTWEIVKKRRKIQSDFFEIISGRQDFWLETYQTIFLMSKTQFVFQKDDPKNHSLKTFHCKFLRPVDCFPVVKRAVSCCGMFVC